MVDQAIRTASQGRVIVLEPLTREAFADFGDVIDATGPVSFPTNGGTATRVHGLAVADCAAERGKTLPYILNWAEAGAKLSGVDVVRGFNQTMAIRAAAAKLFCEVDYVISPVSPVVNFPAEFAAPLNDPAKPFEHICFTVPWNMSENPALSINGGYDKKGFPIGVQIIGRRFDDIGVLGMGKAFEGLRGPQKPWPAPPKK